MNNNIYKDKKVLITGNTGFKGSWLTTWLLKLGAEVVGVSIGKPTNPSMFSILELDKKITYYEQDIRDLSKLEIVINKEKPDFVFHLAAQPLVSVSYSDPTYTMSTNIIGTMNILEVLRKSNHKCTAVIITSDKAYDNIEQIWGYKENDKMGGKDIYSGSKGAAELVIKSYYHSFFKSEDSNVKLAVGRAGNVIGGGDWAKDRIVVDCMKAWNENKTVEIRSPKATRPWQHVLEPLGGYLKLGAYLDNDSNLNGECFNFGPNAEQNRTVVELIESLGVIWGGNDKPLYEITDNLPFHEASLLKLNCDKSLAYLNWQATLNYNETINYTNEWYRAFYIEKSDMYNLTTKQIEDYENKIK